MEGENGNGQQVRKLAEKAWQEGWNEGWTEDWIEDWAEDWIEETEKVRQGGPAAGFCSGISQKKERQLSYILLRFCCLRRPAACTIWKIWVCCCMPR